MPVLSVCSLVGGTALALKYGHRLSIDLDLFTEKPFDPEKIIEALTKEFGNDFLYEGGELKWGIFCFIQNVKVDIVHYPHARIFPLTILENIPVYPVEDIAAMKLNAILGRGKKKDFWDIHELLQRYSLAEMIGWHKQKFPNQMLLISIPQALTYFDDAEISEDPVSLKNQTWQEVKKGIKKKVSEYLK